MCVSTIRAEKDYANYSVVIKSKEYKIAYITGSDQVNISYKLDIFFDIAVIQVRLPKHVESVN